MKRRPIGAGFSAWVALDPTGVRGRQGPARGQGTGVLGPFQSGL